ncbi:MAG: metallophosphoesterase, partial [Thermoguttaceae bacterium]|nr:metallophosphoesterase [Thermoguttaceae bacterium]
MASAFPVPNLSAYAEDSDELKIIPIEIPCGTQKPFKAVHVSDTHLCLVDERENERKRKLAENRQRYFTKGEKFFDLAMAYAQKKDALFLHTGDMIDFVSEKNLEAIQAKFQDTYSFASTGNHEFSQYVGEAKEDAAYKALSFDRVQKVYPHNITFCSRIINGVNFIAFDDVYYNVTAEQLACFKAEAEKGLPIIAMCHCPLYTPDLFENAMNHEGLRCAYLVGVPEEKMADYTPGDREQQKPDIPTLD